MQVRTADGAAVLTVTDHGPGVPEAFVPTAVERFARADARQRPGAGLGLSLVHALADRYEGELRLCSDGRHHRYKHQIPVACRHPRIGTTASVLLPTI